MKKIINTLLTLCLITYSIVAQNEFFDDFNYSDPDDPIIENFGWDVLNGPNWPGQNGPVPYLKENVNFIDNTATSGDRILTLSTQTTNQLADRSFSRVEYSEYIFLEGVYAARVHFDNNPANYDDGNVQTFYTIFNAPSGDPEHAECDFEYLAYNIWGGGNTTNTLLATTWESYILEPWQPTNASTGVQADFSDDWKVLVFTVKDNTVTYYVDNELFATHTVADQDGTTSVYPDNLMQISLANWIWSNNALPLGPSPELRTTTMQVDWVYHLQNDCLTPTEVLDRVEQLRTTNVLRKNTMNESSSTHTEPKRLIDFEVYPNPGTGEMLTIKNNKGDAHATHVEIKNASGTKLFEKEYYFEKGGEQTVSLSNIPKGLYFVIISTENHTELIKWIVN